MSRDKFVLNSSSVNLTTNNNQTEPDLNQLKKNAVTIELDEILKETQKSQFREDSHPTKSPVDDVGKDKDIWKEISGTENEVPWKSMTTLEKVKRSIINIVKVLFVFGFLYFFVCSLELLSSSFSLISGKSTGALVNNEYIDNPIVDLMIGILLTVLVQSSSTSTSIIVSMVAVGIIEVSQAVPMVMGANIGTSVTNTIVSLTQVGNKENFRRAFSGATVHDMFNWMAVLVLLPLEIITGMLEALTGVIVNSIAGANGVEILFLETVTSPFTSLIIMLDHQIEECWGIGFMKDEESLIVKYCNTTVAITTPTTFSSTIWTPSTTTEGEVISNTTDQPVPLQCQKNDSVVGVPGSCHFLFYETNMDDTVIGVILLFMSLFILCGSLICIVKILNSLLKGSIAKVIQKVINADIPYVPWLTGYIAMFIGAILTFIVQSSSVFTSTLTPLIGLGIITVERAYPLTLGSNIGTTTTALLAALAVTGNKKDSVQIALVHFFFNICGILLYYPVPFMRVPIPMCKALGRVTAHYRWFAIFYLISVFFVLPFFIFGLSMAGPAAFWGVLVPVVVFIIVIVIINKLQTRAPRFLPSFLKNWDFLPKPLRSLDPYDKVFTALPCCKKCRNEPDEENHDSNHSAELTRECSLNSIIPDSSSK